MGQSRFTRDDAKRYYDWFGAKQDSQGFYEDAALEALIAHGDFSHAQSVFEFGCGTGKLAAQLLAEHLPKTARYIGVDISETMIGLAKDRVQPWAGRTEARLTSGDFDFAAHGGPFDRFISAYVFDQLEDEDIASALDGAHATLRKGGLLCAASLTKGTGFPSSFTSGAWACLRSLKPSLVGGCRPLVLSERLPEEQWKIRHRQTIVAATIPSEVVISEAI